MPPPRVLFRSSPLRESQTGTAVEITPARAGWRFVHFAVRQVVPGQPWEGTTGREECCLILLRGRDRNILIPFGPYLAAAGWIALMWGPQIVDGYLTISGLNR